MNKWDSDRNTCDAPDQSEETGNDGSADSNVEVKAEKVDVKPISKTNKSNESKPSSKSLRSVSEESMGER